MSRPRRVSFARGGARRRSGDRPARPQVRARAHNGRGGLSSGLAACAMGPVSLVVFRALSGFGMSEQAVNAAYLNEVFGRAPKASSMELFSPAGRSASCCRPGLAARCSAARLAGSFRRCDFPAHRHTDSPLRPQGIALFPKDPAPEAAQSSGRDRRRDRTRQAMEPRYRAATGPTPMPNCSRLRSGASRSRSGRCSSSRSSLIRN